MKEFENTFHLDSTKLKFNERYTDDNCTYYIYDGTWKLENNTY